MGAIHLSRTVSFYTANSLRHPKEAPPKKNWGKSSFEKFPYFFQVSADFKTLVVGGELGGMIFLFGSVRVTNPNCWCFILLVFSASKASGVLKNPIPVLPWSHYSCTFFNMSSFEQESFHKNQHESSLSADFLLRRLDDFPKVSTIARFPPVFSTGKKSSSQMVKFQSSKLVQF